MQESLVEIPRDDLVLLLESGYIYLAMNKLKEAKEVFEGVIALSPNHEVPRVALANVYFAQKKYLQAIRILKEALEINPKSAFAYAYLGEAYVFDGKKEKALEALDKASKLDLDGSSGSFAKALLELINQGFDPVELKKKALALKKSQK